jgi:hypothetical protein
MSADTQYIRTADDIEGGAAITLLAKGCAEILERHYPGWLWTIIPDVKQGIIDITSQLLNTKWVYTLHIRVIQNDPTLRDVLRAGGEILERFGFRRGPYDPEDWKRRKGDQVVGHLMPTVVDKSKFEQRRAKVDRINAEIAGGAARIFTDDRIGAALRAAGRTA